MLYSLTYTPPMKTPLYLPSSFASHGLQHNIAVACTKETHSIELTAKHREKKQEIDLAATT